MANLIYNNLEYVINEKQERVLRSRYTVEELEDLLMSYFMLPDRACERKCRMFINWLERFA